MTQGVSRKLRLNFWPFTSGTQGTSFYSDSEKELIRQQLQASNARARSVAAKRGYSLHPKVAAAKANG